MTAPARRGGRQREPIRHGTTGGYRAHFRHGVPMCEPCRAADRTRRGWKAPQPVAKCGTVSGYRRHRRNGEEPCAACLAGNAAAGRKYRAAARRARGFSVPRTGTEAA